MPNDIKKLLESINDVSRQLLSRIQTIQKDTIENNVIVKNLNKAESESITLIENEAAELQKQRDQLIHCLFEENTPEKITSEKSLLDQMISIDYELVQCSKMCKKGLSEKVIRLKKGKSVSKSYQNY